MPPLYPIYPHVYGEAKDLKIREIAVLWKSYESQSRPYRRRPPPPSSQPQFFSCDDRTSKRHITIFPNRRHNAGENNTVSVFFFRHKEQGKFPVPRKWFPPYVKKFCWQNGLTSSHRAIPFLCKGVRWYLYFRAVCDCGDAQTQPPEFRTY